MPDDPYALSPAALQVIRDHLAQSRPSLQIDPALANMQQHGVAPGIGPMKLPHQELAERFGVPHALEDVSQPTYLRIGSWNPKREQSNNYATGDIEHGLSVYDLNKARQPIEPQEGEWAGQDMRDRLSGSEPKFLVQGQLVGQGGDGEPLLQGMRVVGEYK